jgi:rRNA-processing protein FCF1
MTENIAYSFQERKSEQRVGSLFKAFFGIFKSNNRVLNLLIDASVMGYEKVFELIQELIGNTGRKIIIIPIINEELDKLQKFKGEDVSKSNARKFLNMAAQNKDNMFVYDDFESNYDRPDDVIQDYAYRNKKSVMLISADKRLIANCRAMDIPVCFVNLNNEKPKSRGKRIATFYNAKFVDGHLLLVSTNPVTSFMVKHGGDIFRHIPSGETYDLKLGDEVLLCRARFDTDGKPYVAFSHYEIISISDKRNISTIYTHRFYDSSEVLGLWNSEYKSFILKFMEEHFTHGEMCNTGNKQEFIDKLKSTM